MSVHLKVPMSMNHHLWVLVVFPGVFHYPASELPSEQEHFRRCSLLAPGICLRMSMVTYWNLISGMLV